MQQRVVEAAATLRSQVTDLLPPGHTLVQPRRRGRTGISVQRLIGIPQQTRPIKAITLAIRHGIVTAADLTSVLCLVGSVFAILSRYAVQFWNQGLHQGTSIPVATGERSVADVFWYPLLLSMIGFGLLFVALVLYRTGTEIRLRRAAALRARAGREVA